MTDTTTIEILQEAYKSCCTGISALNTVISKSKSYDFANTLKNRRTEYKKLAHDIACELAVMHTVPRCMNAFERISLKGGLQLDTFIHSSDMSLAGIIINASSAGISDMKGRLNTNRMISSNAKELCGRLIECERSNIDILKDYL